MIGRLDLGWCSTAGGKLLQHIVRACVLAGHDLHEPARRVWCPCARDGREGGACILWWSTVWFLLYGLVREPGFFSPVAWEWGFLLPGVWRTSTAWEPFFFVSCEFPLGLCFFGVFLAALGRICYFFRTGLRLLFPSDGGGGRCVCVCS
jgi:hypothetical protein